MPHYKETKQTNKIRTLKNNIEQNPFFYVYHKMNLLIKNVFLLIKKMAAFL